MQTREVIALLGESKTEIEGGPLKECSRKRLESGGPA